MSVPWKLIAIAFGWHASFRMEGAYPKLIIHHRRHSTRLAGGRRVEARGSDVDPRSPLHDPEQEIQTMTTWLVAVNILVTAETTNPRAHIAEAARDPS